MGPSEYVLCMWNKRLWPAKVLSQPRNSSRNAKLNVEIFAVNTQIDVSVTNTKPFLMDELQKLGDALKDRNKNNISPEEVNYQMALKLAVDIIQQLSCSAPQSTGEASTKVYEHKETTARRKERKSSGITARQNTAKRRGRGKCATSNKNQKDSDAEASEDSLEIPKPRKSVAQKTEKNTRRPLAKKQADPPCGQEAGRDVSPAGSKKNGWRKRSKQHPVQRSKQHPVQRSKKVQKSHTDLQAESSTTDKEKGNGRRACKYLKKDMPDFEDEKGLSSSELSMEVSSPEYKARHVVSLYPDDTEEDIQLPVVVLQKEPDVITPGSFVWCKFQHYPYWPSLVKGVDAKQKKVTVIFLEESISDSTKKNKGFKVAHRSVKHYDCPEKQQLLENARKDYGKSIDWCDSLIADYRIRLGCGSFSGSFMDYCTAAISLPVRRELEGGKKEILFPAVVSEVTKREEEKISVKSQSDRKLLPDRTRAARDRENKKLVEFILNAKETEKHLLDILSRKKPSEWLEKFQSSYRKLNCLETYIEDEKQMELVVGYLQNICEKMNSARRKQMFTDQTQFIFEVLIPEAVIFAIAATEKMSYKQAEVKYLKGPPVTKRDRRLFEEQILAEKRLKLSEEAEMNTN